MKLPSRRGQGLHKGEGGGGAGTFFFFHGSRQYVREELWGRRIAYYYQVPHGVHVYMVA